MNIPILVVMSTAALVAPFSWVSATDANTKPPSFLFSEDNKITGSAEQFNLEIAPKTIIHDDKWLNEPLTRLDYVLINIKSHLDKNLSNTAQYLIQEYFERPAIDTPTVEFGAGYSNKNGRLFIAASIEHAGKPKKPMKEFCRSLLDSISLMYPLEPLGYGWQDNALGVLMREERGDYKDIVQKLVKSAVITVSVSSVHPSSGRSGFFELGCRLREADGPVTFFKYSGLM